MWATSRVVAPFDNEESSYASKTLTTSYAFSAPGTYFPALRVTSHRRGEMDNPHGRIQNLGRVRVVVAEARLTDLPAG